jgi:dethiobiotin synthetase
MGKILLVTGTDTGVGKTIAAAWLAKTLATHTRVALVKAVQTGAVDPLVDGDEAAYRAFTGNPAIATHTLATFSEPLAPSIAARRAGRKIAPALLVKECKAIARRYDITIVEGAGGLLVPIAKAFDFADLAKALQAPLVIVIRPGLGTLNHTMLTVEAAERRGLSIEALVCSGLSPKRPVVEVENLRFLQERYPKLPLIALYKATPRELARLALRPRYLGKAPGMFRRTPRMS